MEFRYYPELIFIILLAISVSLFVISGSIIQGLLVFSIAVLVFFLTSYMAVPKTEGEILELNYLLKASKGKFIEINVPISKFVSYFEEYFDRNYLAFVNYSAIGEIKKFLDARSPKDGLAVLTPGEIKDLLKLDGGIIHAYIVVTYRNPLKSKFVDSLIRVSNNKVIDIFCNDVYIERLVKAKFKIDE